MPKTKAGRLTPQIHQMKKDIEDKKDSLSAAERRSLIHRLKRAQRKANLIQKEEDRVAAMTKKPEKAAPAEEAAAPAAPAEEKVEAKPEETAEAKPEEKVEEKPAEQADVKTEEPKSDEKPEA
jgi:hypothetical protein